MTLYLLATLALIVLVTIVYGMTVRDIRIAKKRSRSTAIILPYIPTPSTLGELAEAYTLIINAPFAEAREGLGRSITSSLYPTLQTTIKRYDHGDMLYDTVCRIIAFIHTGVFISCFGLAILIHEPLFIIAYLICFCAWALWTIARYPYVSLLQKATLILLLPSMTGYFFYRLSTAPVRGLARTTH